MSNTIQDLENEINDLKYQILELESNEINDLKYKILELESEAIDAKYYKDQVDNLEIEIDRLINSKIDTKIEELFNDLKVEFLDDYKKHLKESGEWVDRNRIDYLIQSLSEEIESINNL